MTTTPEQLKAAEMCGTCGKEKCPKQPCEKIPMVCPLMGQPTLCHSHSAPSAAELCKPDHPCECEGAFHCAKCGCDADCSCPAPKSAAEDGEGAASVAHKIWSHWMLHFFQIQNPVLEYDRWKRQMNTPYEDLSEQEKASDRRVAERYIIPLLAQREAEAERRGSEGERSKLRDGKTIVVRRYNDGMWWCHIGPMNTTCAGMCAGHHTFEDWAAMTQVALAELTPKE